MAELKSFDDMYLFVVYMPHGESILTQFDNTGMPTPMIYRRKEDISEKAYEFVRHVSDEYKAHIELKQYRCVERIQQFFPENTLTM